MIALNSKYQHCAVQISDLSASSTSDLFREQTYFIIKWTEAAVYLEAIRGFVDRNTPRWTEF